MQRTLKDRSGYYPRIINEKVEYEWNRKFHAPNPIFLEHETYYPLCKKGAHYQWIWTFRNQKTGIRIEDHPYYLVVETLSEFLDLAEEAMFREETRRARFYKKYFRYPKHSEMKACEDCIYYITKP